MRQLTRNEAARTDARQSAPTLREQSESPDGAATTLVHDANRGQGLARAPHPKNAAKMKQNEPAHLITTGAIRAPGTARG